jgi:hypothetical protein
MCWNISSAAFSRNNVKMQIAKCKMKKKRHYGIEPDLNFCNFKFALCAAFIPAGDRAMIKLKNLTKTAASSLP